MGASIQNELRKYLKSINDELAKRAEHLWLVSKQIHERQNSPGNPNENGRIHIEMVEDNIWRLLFDENNPNKEKNKRDFKDYEIFLLSAVACCHDFDKAKGELPPNIKHGEDSGNIVKNNKLTFDLPDYQANDIADVISLHGIKNAKSFKKRLQGLSTNQPSSYGPFNLQRITLLLKTADILHLDERRISSLMGHITNPNSLGKIERKKYLSRSCTRGWNIDGSHIIVYAEPKDDDEKQAFLQCFKWMKKNEWPAVKEGLKQYRFPYEIESKTRKQKTKRKGIKMPKATTSSQNINIPLDGRFLNKEKTNSMLLMLIERKDKYPICRNESTTHAAASAIAIFSVLTMMEKIYYLRNELKTRFLELLRERERNPRKLADHITSLSESKSLLLRIIRDNPEIATATKTFQEIPGNDEVYKNLNDMSDTLSNSIDKMYKKYKKIAEEIIRSKGGPGKIPKEIESEKWSRDIDELFTETKIELFNLCEQLIGILENINKIKESINQDWERDIDQTWNVENHAHCPT